MKPRTPLTVLACSVATLLAAGAGGALALDLEGLTPMEKLGALIFFDETLSIRQNQACASCHVPEVGWVGEDSEVNLGGSVYEGSRQNKFGDRKPPSPPTQPCRRSSTSTPCWASREATSGTAARRAGSSATSPPIRPRGPSSTPSSRPCRMPPASSTGCAQAPTASCSARSGAAGPTAPSSGRRIPSASATAPPAR